MSERSSSSAVRLFVSRLLEDEDLPRSFSPEGFPGHDQDDPAVKGEIDRRRDAAATREFGQHVGLNADWSVTAWFLGPGRPNLTDGAYYFLDSEDGTWNVVRRWDEESPQWREEVGQVEDVFSSEDFEAAFAKAKEVRDQMRALSPEERAKFHAL